VNQLAHAPVRLAIILGDVILWKAIDEDSSKRLLLALVGCGVGIQKEPAATGVIHD
jgi:hypothetical protein